MVENLAPAVVPSHATEKNSNIGDRCTTTAPQDVETIKKGANHFSIQRIVIPTGCTEKFGVNDRCVVSQQ